MGWANVARGPRLGQQANATTPRGVVIAPPPTPGGGTPLTTPLGIFVRPPTNQIASDLAQWVSVAVFNAGDETYLDGMKAAGYAGKFYQYVMFNDVRGPGTADPVVSDGSYAVNVNDSNQAYLHTADYRTLGVTYCRNGAGNRLTASNGNGWTRYPKPNDATLRAHWTSDTNAFWFDVAAKYSRYSGCFLDNADTAFPTNRFGIVPWDGSCLEYAGLPSDQSAFRTDVAAAFASIKSGLPASRMPTNPWDHKLWGNFTQNPTAGNDWDPFLSSVDGILMEFFCTNYSTGSSSPYTNGGYRSQAVIEAQMTQIDTVLAAGKEIIVNAQGEYIADTDQQQRFALGCFWMCYAPGAYFRYSEYQKYRSFWNYTNYHTDVGAPSGARTKPTSTTMRRVFANTTIDVDFTTHLVTGF